MFEPRCALIFCATCGVTLRSRAAVTKAAMSQALHEVSPVKYHSSELWSSAVEGWQPLASRIGGPRNLTSGRVSMIPYHNPACAGGGSQRERDHSCTTATKCHAYDRSHATPVSTAAFDCCVSLWSGPQSSPCRHQASLNVSPERNQELARQRYNHDSPDPSSLLADTLGEPLCKCAPWLVAKPEPCRLNKCCSSARVT